MSFIVALGHLRRLLPPDSLLPHVDIKKMEGHYVHTSNAPGTQRHVCWHPGARVGLRKKYLYAQEAGVIGYTKEVYVRHPHNWEAVDLSPGLPKGTVAPAQPVGVFKLVAML